MRGLRSAGTLAAFTALTLTCAACSSSSGDSGAKPPSSGSASASSTTKATTTPHSSTTASAAGPVVPSAARSHTPAGAVAFVKFYIDEVNTAWTTPQTGLIPALSLPTCKTCADLESSTKELANSKSHYTRPSVAIEHPEYRTLPGPHPDVVTGTIVDTPMPVADATSTDPPQGQQSRTPTAIELVWQRNCWTVSEIKVLK